MAKSKETKTNSTISKEKVEEGKQANKKKVITDESIVIHHEYNKLLVKELKSLVQKRGLEVPKSANKEELIAVLVRDDQRHYNDSKAKEVREENAANHKVHKAANWALPIAIVAIILVLLAATLTWFFLSLSVVYVEWGPKEITFYSQLPYSGYSTDDVDPDSVTIDGGFNDAVYDGAYHYSESINNWHSKKKPIGFSQSISWSTDSDQYLSDFWGLDAQYSAGAKTVISSGSNIAEAYETLYTREGYTDDDFAANGWQSIVIDDSSLAQNHESAISVSFDAADAGFLAGLAATVYTLDLIVDPSADISGESISDDLVTWGGSSYSTVYDWMSGFEQGINYFNYKVLGVDVNDDIHEADDTTLGLYLSDGFTGRIDDGYNVELEDGFELTNGVYNEDGTTGINIDYNTSFSTNNSVFNSLTVENQGSSWYTGSFDSDIDEGAGLLAWNRSNQSVENNVSTLFPVAGGQTEIATALAGTNSSTKIIGVDVDGTEADPDYADAYLGSATKNLTDSASLALWESEGAKGNSEFGGISGEDFNTDTTESDKGWKVTDDSIVGKQYEGTFENGGVGFITSTFLDDAYNGLIDTLDITNAPSSFLEFAKYAYSENNEIGIENSSTTFTPSGTQTKTQAAIAPWIPDWTVYINNY